MTIKFDKSNELLEYNIFELLEYFKKPNYKNKLKQNFIVSFMKIQESMIIDNELDINKRMKINRYIIKSVLHHYNYNNKDYSNIISKVIQVYDKIFNIMESENYLTEKEIEIILGEVNEKTSY